MEKGELRESDGRRVHRVLPACRYFLCNIDLRVKTRSIAVKNDRLYGQEEVAMREAFTVYLRAVAVPISNTQT